MLCEPREKHLKKDIFRKSCRNGFQKRGCNHGLKCIVWVACWMCNPCKTRTKTFRSPNTRLIEAFIALLNLQQCWRNPYQGGFRAAFDLLIIHRCLFKLKLDLFIQSCVHVFTQLHWTIAERAAKGLPGRLNRTLTQSWPINAVFVV